MCPFLFRNPRQYPAFKVTGLSLMFMWGYLSLKNSFTFAIVSEPKIKLLMNTNLSVQFNGRFILPRCKKTRTMVSSIEVKGEGVPLWVGCKEFLRYLVRIVLGRILSALRLYEVSTSIHSLFNSFLFKSPFSFIDAYLMQASDRAFKRFLDLSCTFALPVLVGRPIFLDKGASTSSISSSSTSITDLSSSVLSVRGGGDSVLCNNNLQY